MNISTATEDNGESSALDPAMERVRRKMVRLLVVSISIMMAGLLAVLFAVVYKVTDAEDNEEMIAQTSQPFADGQIKIPNDEDIVSVSLDGTHILVHTRGSTTQHLLIYDIRNGKVLARVAVE